MRVLLEKQETRHEASLFASNSEYEFVLGEAYLMAVASVAVGGWWCCHLKSDWQNGG